jgi:hypothetical protein
MSKLYPKTEKSFINAAVATFIKLSYISICFLMIYMQWINFNC